MGACANTTVVTEKSKQLESNPLIFTTHTFVDDVDGDCALDSFGRGGGDKVTLSSGRGAEMNYLDCRLPYYSSQR
jgi:microcompartment protein CcmK/EutM